MFAVIKTGGKQYKVSAGDTIWVEKLDVNSGDAISMTDVLMLDDGKEKLIGTPLIANAQVNFTVIDQARNDKIIIFKKKRRQNYRRKQGHRQCQTILMVEGISLDGKIIATAPQNAENKKEEKKKIEVSKKEASSKEPSQETSTVKSKKETKSAPKTETSKAKSDKSHSKTTKKVKKES